MKESEITALAREYAEEIYPNLSDKIISRRTQEIKDAERVIRFLLRRYCLVEKTKIKAVYQDISESYYCDFHNRDTVLKEGSQMKLLESLFPEIAKEVES